jgi:hypothetical protein
VAPKADDPPLFWGYTSRSSGGITRSPANPRQADNIDGSVSPLKTASEAFLEFGKWTPHEVQTFLKEAINTGLLPATADYFDAKTLWGKLVQDSVDKYGAGVNISPLDVFATLGADVRGLGGSKARGAGGPDDRPYTNRSSRTESQPIDHDTAVSLARDVYQQALGRGLTKAEEAKAAKAAQRYAAKHPTTTSSVERVTPNKGRNGGTSKTTVTNSGGYTQRGLAENQLQELESTDEYASFQAATTYMNAFMQAVGPTVGGVPG